MACGRADVIDGVSGQSIGSFGYGESDKDLTVVDLLNKWEIPTASVLFKKVDAAAYYADWTFDKPVAIFLVQFILPPLAMCTISVTASPFTDIRFRGHGRHLSNAAGKRRFQTR